jgi:acid phosphatase
MDIAVGNLDDWVVPTGCGSAVEDYVENGQYEADFAAAVESVRTFVNTLGPPGQDGLDMWILDIDETSLSNVPFFEKYTDWGTEEWTAAVQELWDSWVMEGTARALVPTLELFLEMRRTGWQVAFITGRSEAQRDVTKSNLLAAGYSGWQSLTLRSPEEMDEPATLYKSRHRQDLVSQGYRILGGMGDQWSDLQGQAAGQRTFKLPNPMFYVG